MNPIAAVVLLAFAVGVGFAPWRGAGWKTPGIALLAEAVALVAAVVAATLLADLVSPTAAGLRWGRIGLYAAAYWYACAGGIGWVRMVLALVPVAADPARGGIAVSETEMGRGRIIGVLERAIALSLILLGEYLALGLVAAVKALARFRALDDRDFAEYFLIGTFASLVHAFVVGLGLRLLL